MKTDRLSVVAVGASAGGFEAVVELMGTLGPDFDPAVLLVQHRHRHSGGSLAESLRRATEIRAVEVADHQRIEPAVIHVAPANYHMLVASRRTLVLSVDAPVHHSRPSVDVLFESAADVFGDELTGVILTGANEDGARGLAAVREAGGRCFVQDPSTAEASTMPRAALAAVPDACAMSVREIGARIREGPGRSAPVVASRGRGRGGDR